MLDGGVVIGTDSGTEIRVAPGGAVFSVDPRGELTTRFMNSSIGQLADCVAAYADYSARVATVGDEAQARGLVLQLRGTMARIDAAALGSSEVWWALVLEQAEDGLL